MFTIVLQGFVYAVILEQLLLIISLHWPPIFWNKGILLQIILLKSFIYMEESLTVRQRMGSWQSSTIKLVLHVNTQAWDNLFYLQNGKQVPAAAVSRKKQPYCTPYSPALPSTACFEVRLLWRTALELQKWEQAGSDFIHNSCDVSDSHDAGSKSASQCRQALRNLL